MSEKSTKLKVLAKIDFRDFGLFSVQ